MMKYVLQALLLFTLVLAAVPLTGQQKGAKAITLEDIWLHKKFQQKEVEGFNFLKDGRHYSKKEGDRVFVYDIVTGKLTDTLFDGVAFPHLISFEDYQLSSDEKKMLIETRTRKIYRRSTKAIYYIYDMTSKNFREILGEEYIMHCTFSPDGNAVAFVFDNDLYWKDLDSGEIRQITTDGVKNEVINGNADWVYEEEFGFTKAFSWSPDGRKIAFYRFDESKVPEFTMTNYNGALYPDYETFKYPKVGETISDVEIHVYDINSGDIIVMDVYSTPDGYIPRMQWTKDPDRLCITKLNRHQNHLRLMLADVRTGRSATLLEERNPYFIDIHDNLFFLSDGSGFIWTSEKDGWEHIYHYDMDGRLKYRLTPGEFDVTEVYGVDEKHGTVYYQAAAVSPLEREVYAVDLQGTQTRKISKGNGTTKAEFSETFDYYTLQFHTRHTPSIYGVFNRKGEQVRILEDNMEVRRRSTEYGFGETEFFQFMTKHDVSLNGYMIKPKEFDPDKQYPVIMFVYGGPGSQKVLNAWEEKYNPWFQMLAQQGYIVACVDNRGTGARGERFRKMTYMQLGHYETIDQIEAAKYLGNLEYIDPERIGIMGWSYGGYMSSLCILKGNDVFRSAIAVAPVTSWEWYDCIYTERYMRTATENPDGYANNAPVNFANNLKGDYLLVHGGSDDNVHFQHSAEMVSELVKANRQFDLLFYPNNDHKIEGDNARLHLYTKMTNFIHETLGEGAKINDSAHNPDRS